MKLFIDTSNKKLIFGLIDEFNNVVDFYIDNTNNDIVKRTLVDVKKFLMKNKLELNKINNFLITIGPGSFTGVKVALNILNSVALINEIESVKVIDSFKLIEQDEFDSTVIPFGKSKFYFKKKKSKKITIISEEDFKKLDNVNNGYDNFTKEILEQKINSKAFKLVDNLDKIKIKYLSTF